MIYCFSMWHLLLFRYPIAVKISTAVLIVSNINLSFPITSKSNVFVQDSPAFITVYRFFWDVCRGIEEQIREMRLPEVFVSSRHFSLFRKLKSGSLSIVADSFSPMTGSKCNLIVYSLHTSDVLNVRNNSIILFCRNLYLLNN